MKKIFIFMITFAMIIALSGCTEKSPEIVAPIGTPKETLKETPREPIIEEGNVIFDEIDKGTLLTADINNNAIFVAEKINETEKFTKWDSSLAEKIKNINTGDVLIVGVFLNMATSGYEISITGINQKANKITLTATLSSPAEMASPVISYPYHIITIPKVNINVVPGTTWEVITQEGTVLAQTQYP